MGFSKIEQKDYEEKGVTGLPDIPRLDTLDMQKKFDELSKDVAFPKHNLLVDELEGEAAADSLGIADDVKGFSNPTKKIKPLLVLFGNNIKKNSDDRHTHDNKTVLDSITDIAIKAWDKVASLFESIDGVEDTVSGRASKIPSSMAIAKYVQQMGGGDMVKSIYDRNGNDIVDDAEALGGQPPEHYQSAEDQKLQTTSKNVVGAVNEVFNKTKDVLNTKEEIEANTDPTAIAGALSVKELSNDLGGLSFGQDADGNWGYKVGGADTVHPFRTFFLWEGEMFKNGIVSEIENNTFTVERNHTNFCCFFVPNKNVRTIKTVQSNMETTVTVWYENGETESIRKSTNITYTFKEQIKLGLVSVETRSSLDGRVSTITLE